MKMPPNKPIGNGYYGYKDVTYFPTNQSMDPVPSNGNPTNENNPPNMDLDFSEYLWMENEEEFEREVMQQLEEQELMEQIEAIFEDEQSSNTNTPFVQETESNEIVSLVNNFKLDLYEIAKTSTLNPLAAEFVPDNRASPSISNSP